MASLRHARPTRSIFSLLSLLSLGTTFTVTLTTSHPATAAESAALPALISKKLPLAEEADLTPKTGEIHLEGTITALSETGFSLSAVAFSLPNGKSAELPSPKRKLVALTSQTVIVPIGDPFWRLDKSSLKAGMSISLVGPDAGSGQGIEPRSIAIRRYSLDGMSLDYFVAQNGNDAGDGSAQNPWRSLTKAIASIPSGTPETPRVLHIGAGHFSASSDGNIALWNIAEKQNLIITGMGARSEGTQIDTTGYSKRGKGIITLSNCSNIAFCNLILGDDRAWEEQEAFFQATLQTINSTVQLNSVELLGPSRDTLDDAEAHRAPTALRPADPKSQVILNNVLVMNHGTFLSNPQGRVTAKRVTFAGQCGVAYDDVMLFLQTPKNSAPNVIPGEHRYNLTDCIFYELQGSKNHGYFRMTMGIEGEDKAYFAPPSTPTAGNWLVRVRGSIFTPEAMGRLFDGRRDGHYSLAQGIWQDNDVNAPLTGNLKINDDVYLSSKNGFLYSSPNQASGWVGGFTNGAEMEKQLVAGTQTSA